MRKLYEKSEILFAVAWIIGYCVLASIGDNLSEKVGITKIVSLPILIVLSLVLIVFVKKNQLVDKYGLCKPKLSASKMLFYLPAFFLLTVNLWDGAVMNYSVAETILYILFMLCVGFLEEMIFRGLLFKALLKDGVKSAIIVSSITFGLGHFINLINGSGAEFFSNIIQVIYAIAIGFMLVMLFYRTKSLLPCIFTHGIFSALSVFAKWPVRTTWRSIFTCIFIVSIVGGYALYLAYMKEENN